MYPNPEDDEFGVGPLTKGLTNVRAQNNSPDLTEWLEDVDDGDEPVGHPLDNAQNQALHARLKSWFDQEMERQAVNRFQQSLDEDYYDSLQWTDEDAQVLLNRRQAPLVFNQVKPTVDWLIGTEKRTRMDFNVLPREEDDVDAAKAKTKLLKYQSDVNKEVYSRSRAFADAVKAGIGIMEDGVRADPTEEPIYSRYENWRYCLHDSTSYETDGSDMRFFFRWRYPDLDTAIAMFPDREGTIRAASIGALSLEDEQDQNFWYLGARPSDSKDLGVNFNRHSQTNSAAYADNRRERVRLLECWYRVPVRETVVIGGGMDGQVFDESNESMQRLLQEGWISTFDRVAMKVYCAVMTDGHLLQNVASPYKHNRFPFTIYWGYRRKRDNLPYGVVRAIRDPQDDLNKRISKSLHILSTKQVIMEAGAVDDIDELREEVAAPDGVIIRNRGKELEIKRDEFELQHQAVFMERDALTIREVGGVNSENLGRDTNANSGKAILAKQDQGGLVTAELFDNLMLGFQLQGEIRLSLTEQYYTDRKVVRIIGNRGKLDWLKINYPDPEQGKILNDITARAADFVVSEQDYRATVRLAMFETLANVVGKLPPEMAIQFLDLLVEVGDVPEKEEFLRRVRQINGQVDPDEEMSEEDQQKQAAAAEKQAKREAFTEHMAGLEAAEKEAAVRKTNAEAAVKEAEAGAAGSLPDANGALDQQAGEMQQQFAEQLAAVQLAAEQQIAALAEQVAQLRQEAANKVADAEARAAGEHKKAVTEVVKARIAKESAVEVAKINAAADAAEAKIAALEKMVAALMKEEKAEESGE